MKNKFNSFILIVFLSMGLYGCSANNEKEVTNAEPIKRTELFMGTVVTVSLYNEGNEEILDRVFDKVQEIEHAVSINEDGTEIDNLNDNAGKQSVKLSDTAYEIVKKAYYYSEKSEGGYDLTIGPLVKLWSIGLPEENVPTEEEISVVKENIDYSNVVINDDTQEVFLSKENMSIDLGSIAKGYAADEIAKILKEEGVEQAIIDLGGNIYAMGLKNGASNWKIGIQSPFDDRGNIVGHLEIHDKSVVTSGIYERFIEENGKKYHHILNPKTGYPFETEIAGVSIISDKSIDADALSTLVFTKGLEKGLEFVEEIPNTDAIFITKDKEVYITEGIKSEFKIINKEFKLCN